MGRLASGRDELEEITPLLESARLLRAAIPEDAHSLFFQSLSQEHRRLRVHTPLGRDAFLLHRIVGREELSRPYRYELEVLSAQGGIDPADLIGKPVAVEIEREDDDPRWLSGHVAELAHEGSSRGAEIYRLVLVPWLDLLERRSDCRIFQERSVPEILAEVFENAGFRDFETGFLGSYPTRGYCVQYRETDLAFVSRLMEEEGIFYFFRHTEKAHILVLADAAAAYREGPVLRTSSLHPASGLIEDGLRSFEHRWSLQTGRITRRDYNPDQPTFDLGAAEQSIVPVALARVLERYDYPGRYAARAEGRHVARARMEELETRYDTFRGSTHCRSLSAGATFEVEDTDEGPEDHKRYVAVGTSLVASERLPFSEGEPGSDDRSFLTRFWAIPADVVFRPRSATPRARVEGPQTAVVTGPAGEEIWTDEQGRIKVQFHWDRLGKHDEHSSCWVRVSQPHAGRGWGMIDIPRIGEEVVVSFLEGDPDRPLVTGRVYNGANPPPFDLPAQKTRTGLVSQTHKGSGYNEISFDDTAGAEQMRMHAQYDMNSVIGNDQTWDVGNNRNVTIAVDDTAEVGSNQSTSVGAAKTVDVGSTLTVTAGTSITLKCGASMLKMNAGGVITLSGTLVTIAGAANANLMAPVTTVTGAAVLTATGGGLASIRSGGQIDVVAGGDVVAKGATIKLNS